jgi:hypothetical protein
VAKLWTQLNTFEVIGNGIPKSSPNTNHIYIYIYIYYRGGSNDRSLG